MGWWAGGVCDEDPHSKNLRPIDDIAAKGAGSGQRRFTTVRAEESRERGEGQVRATGFFSSALQKQIVFKTAQTSPVALTSPFPL